MKNLKCTLAVLALLAGTSILQAQSIRALEESKYEIGIGVHTMTVDAGRGGKILSYKYGEQEAISQMRWPNSFGSTFWTSPQAEWNWPPVPEYDSQPYTAEVGEGILTLTGNVSRFGYRIRKEFVPDPDDHAIVITYSIVNESGEERKVAPWEITRVPNGGVVFFDAPKESVTPAGLMPFTFEKGAARLEVDVTNENRKVNANGKGWYAFCDNGLVLVKKFQDLAEGEAAPGEAEIQVYINGRKTFVELEAQGPYTLLQPGESLRWTVRWYLVPEEDSLQDTVTPLLQ